MPRNLQKAKDRWEINGDFSLKRFHIIPQLGYLLNLLALILHYKLWEEKGKKVKVAAERLSILLVGSGPVGDDDLWYHNAASQLALPAGSEPPSWIQGPPSWLQGPTGRL